MSVSTEKQLPAIILRPYRLVRTYKDIRTFCPGPKLVITKNITKKDFIQMCNMMGCKPETLSEGGMRCIHTFGLKSLRFHLENSFLKGTCISLKVHERDKWPSVDDFTMTDWAENNSVLIHGNQEFGTTLKSFMNAHAFTHSELCQWETVFNRFGILCVNIPNQDQLDKIS